MSESEGHMFGTTYQAVRSIISQAKLAVININPEVRIRKRIEYLWSLEESQMHTNDLLTFRGFIYLIVMAHNYIQRHYMFEKMFVCYNISYWRYNKVSFCSTFTLADLSLHHSSTGRQPHLCFCQSLSLRYIYRPLFHISSMWQTANNPNQWKLWVDQWLQQIF